LAGTKRGLAPSPPQQKKVARTSGPPPPRGPPPHKGKIASPAAAAAVGSARKRMTIKKPVVLRDVHAYEKKYQVGQGTYGYVVCHLLSVVL
jgi:hypothetical protein